MFFNLLKCARKVANSKCLLKASCFLKMTFGSVDGDISPLSNSSSRSRCALEVEVHLKGSMGGIATASVMIVTAVCGEQLQLK